MKKTTKNIIIALAVLLVLAAAAAALLMMPEPEVDTEESSTASTTTTDSVQIINHSLDQLEKMTLENNIVDETWVIVPPEDEESEYTLIFEGWENVNLVADEISTMARSFYTLYASKEIGEVADLAEYGLKGSGELKAVVEYNDGTKETVIVGITAGETSGRYVLIDGIVYIATFSSMIEQKQTDFVDTGILTVVTPDSVSEDGSTTMENDAVIHRMTLSGKNYPEEVVMQEAENSRVYTYEMLTPIYAGASTTQRDAMIAQLESMTATGVAAVNATEEDLAEWGLDEPSAVIDFEINDEAHVISLGNLVKGEYSLMIDDNQTIYLIDEESVDTWANRTVYDLRECYVYLANIKQVMTLTVEDASGTDTYHITRFLNEEKTTETAPYYDITIEKDGKDVDYDTAYQPFYYELLSVCVMNEESAEPKGDALLTISYDYFEEDTYDKNEMDVLEFYEHPTNDRRCVVLLNGQNVGVVRSSDVQDLLEKNDIIGAYGALQEAD